MTTIKKINKRQVNPIKIELTYKSKIRTGLDPNKKPRIRARIQTKNYPVQYLYTTAVYDIITKKKRSRSVSFGNIRTKKQAYDIIMKWQRKTVKEINTEAKKLGLRL